MTAKPDTCNRTICPIHVRAHHYTRNYALTLCCQNAGRTTTLSSCFKQSPLTIAKNIFKGCRAYGAINCFLLSLLLTDEFLYFSALRQTRGTLTQIARNFIPDLHSDCFAKFIFHSRFTFFLLNSDDYHYRLY